MKKSFLLLVGVLVLGVFQMVIPSQVAHAATFESGTYSIPFELKESGNNNTSIADGYFTKPAKLIVKNGVNYIQLTTNQSDWIKSISGPKGSATVISESGNTRTVQFEAGDITNAVSLKMHVVVPKDIAGMEYDNNHSLRAVFNTSSIPTASTGNAQTTENTESTTGAENTVDNPKTGDESPLGLYLVLLALSVGMFTFYKTRLAKSE